MTDSNAPIGRRRVLIAGSAAAAAVGLGAAVATAGRAEAEADPQAAAAAVCTLTKELTEGPYYLEHALVRSDVSEGKPGIP
ncbi:protocatechuate dioxygenase, partial [Streptomyces sp. MCAF7]